MKKHSRKITTTIILSSVIIIMAIIFLLIEKDNQPLTLLNLTEFLTKPSIFLTNETEIKDHTSEETNLPEEINQLPNQINLEVPFLTQAPYANWDDLHNDACEEAAVIGVMEFLQGQKTLSQDKAEEKIQALVAWQEKNFAGHYDLPLEKVAEMIQKYYQKTSEIYYDETVTIAKIKELVSKNFPVVVPLAGRQLNNPYYRQPGPIYHMLVIRGYDEEKEQFITNDVGTKRGEAYHYNYQTLYDTIHDMPQWQHNKSSLEANPELIFQGRKAILVIK